MPSTELEQAQAAEVDRLLQQQQAEYDDRDIQVPILKVGQALTPEVQDGNAEVGDFIDTVTGEGIGQAVEFISAYYQRGRMLSVQGKGFWVAHDETVPETWADAPGMASFVGSPFTEHPDAEEQFRERVNAGEIEWERGPKVQTTHNYTGLVLVHPLEDSEDEAEWQPFRITFKSAGTKTHNKIRQLQRMKMRNRPTWSYVLELSTTLQTFGTNRAAMVNAKLGRKTTAEEQSEAFDLAKMVAAGRVQTAGSDEEQVAQVPEAKGGLGLD